MLTTLTQYFFLLQFLIFYCFLFYLNIHRYKLQIHGLVVHERIVCMQWSRFETTKEGNELLVCIEKMNLKEQLKSNKLLEMKQA